jgi:hypothetical protein
MRSAVDESFTAWASDYQLQSTPAHPATTWNLVTTAPVPVGEDLQVLVQPATARKLFRLER